MIYSSELAAKLDPFPLLAKRDILGVCGCGNPDGVLSLICRVLAVLGADERGATLSEIAGAPARSPIVEFMLHSLDRSGLVEHGFSIGGAWPSAVGKQLIQAAELFIKDGAVDWEEFGYALNSVEFEMLNPEDRTARLAGGPPVVYG